MRVAIYARYSSENQNNKSIDDQIQACKKHIHDNNLSLEEKRIYADKENSAALSSASRGLQKIIVNKEIDAVVIYDLSVLPDSNRQMLMLVNKFNYYYRIELISVADGFITELLWNK
jgi:site-specific DNA recombinase